MTKEEIVTDWLPRYTDTAVEDFSKFILLTNFTSYVDNFAQKYNVEVRGRTKPMQTATADGITIINFGIGSAMAATIMDLLLAVQPKAVLFLGKCGGLKKKTQLGDLILPIAAIRGEGTSNDFLPVEIPALPSFALQRAVSHVIKRNELDYWTGSVYTTNRRVWEHDEDFKAYLSRIRAMGIDMETATLFVSGFASKVPIGALLLVSDLPLKRGGIKTKKSASSVFKTFTDLHLEIGIKAMSEISEKGEHIRHYKW